MSVHVTFSSKKRLLYFSVMACWERTSSVARIPDKRRIFNFEPPAAEPSPLGPASGAVVVRKHRLEELAGDGARQQPLAILRERRRGPHRWVLSSSVGAWQTWSMKRDTPSYHGYRFLSPRDH